MKFLSLFYILLLAACILLTGCDTDLAKTTAKTDEKVYELIDDAWKDDVGEKVDLADKYPELVKKVKKIFKEAHVPSEYYVW